MKTKLLLISLLFACLSFVMAPAITFATISQFQEKQVGEQFMKDFSRQARIINDPVAKSYLKDLVSRLVSNSSNPKLTTHVFIVNNSSINAFAVPGGYIGIHSGLIKAAKNESQLAAVLAHEITHLTQRHYARSSDIATQAQITSIAAMLAAIAVGGNSKVGAGASMAAMAGSTQSLLNYSRDQEQEADRIGLQVLTKSGFDPNAMAEFFKQLYIKAPSFYESISTHPFATTRIADINNTLKHYKNTPKPKPNEYFQLMRTRVQVDSTENVKPLIRSLSATLNKANSVQHYKYALALRKNRQFSKAKKILEALTHQPYHTRLFFYSLAQTDTQAGDIQEAINLLENLHGIYTADNIILQSYVSTLLLGNQQQKQLALTTIQEQKNDFANRHTYYTLLAKAQADTGDQLAAFQTRAMLFERMGNYKAASAQLHSALTLKSITKQQREQVEALLGHYRSRLKPK